MGSECSHASMKTVGWKVLLGIYIGFGVLQLDIFLRAMLSLSVFSAPLFACLLFSDSFTSKI